MQDIDFAFIGQRIREIRCNKHLTQEYVGDMAGVNSTHISNIELNKVKVSLSTLVRICNAMGITVDYLLENEYYTPASVLEKEIVNTIKDMPKEKQETILRIARVL